MYVDVGLVGKEYVRIIFAECLQTDMVIEKPIYHIFFSVSSFAKKIHQNIFPSPLRKKKVFFFYM